jgi:hypothetical protein
MTHKPAGKIMRFFSRNLNSKACAALRVRMARSFFWLRIAYAHRAQAMESCIIKGIKTREIAAKEITLWVARQFTSANSGLDAAGAKPPLASGKYPSSESSVSCLFVPSRWLTPGTSPNLGRCLQWFGTGRQKERARLLTIKHRRTYGKTNIEG